MAQRFLDQLLKVRKDELPSGAECMICREEYGTVPSDNGTIEHAVSLPCGHHVGSECIAIWLSPGDGLGNSCPLCRTVFFPSYLRDIDEDDDDYDDEGDEDGASDSSEENNEGESEQENENSGGQDQDGAGDQQAPMTVLAAFQRIATSSMPIPALAPAREAANTQSGHEWFQLWPLPTHQQIEDYQKRAQQAVLRPHPTGFLQSDSPQPHPTPTELGSKVASLASAYRTMAYRETLLYLNLTKAGARMPPLGTPHNGLTAQQEEALLWELGQRGAFSARQVRPGRMAMTNRQAWYVHRSNGEVYTYETTPASGWGYWSTGLDFGLREE